MPVKTVVLGVVVCKKHALFFKDQRSEGSVGESIEWDAGTEVCQRQTSYHGLLHYLFIMHKIQKTGKILSLNNKKIIFTVVNEILWVKMTVIGLYDKDEN